MKFNLLVEATVRGGILREVAYSAGDIYTCMNNARTPFGSPRCCKDLEARIEDATQLRDMAMMRSDARTHINGYLKILRRLKRQAEKVNG